MYSDNTQNGGWGGVCHPMAIRIFVESSWIDILRRKEQHTLAMSIKDFRAILPRIGEYIMLPHDNIVKVHSIMTSYQEDICDIYCRKKRFIFL